MNFITKLFNHHPQTDKGPPTVWTWAGESGKNYLYHIYPLDAVFKPAAGIYIYVKQLEDGEWVPLYISQTRDLHQRLEGNVRLEDVAVAGATHIHAHYCEAGTAARYTEEMDLIHRWQPQCNDVFQE